MKKFLLFGFCFFLALVSLNSAIQAANQQMAKPVKYQISAELLPETHMIKARETVTWTNLTQDYVPDLQFHLYWNAFKNELSTLALEAKRERLFRRYRPKEDKWGWIKILSMTTASGHDLLEKASFISPDEPPNPNDETVLRVELPEPLAPGQSVEINLEFQAKVPQNGLRTGVCRDGYFVSQWFPKPGVYEEGKGWNCHEYHLNSEFYADFADFLVKITVPQNFIVGACGEEIDRIPDPVKGKVTYVYRQDGIHDFAWAASPRFLKIERWFRSEEEVKPEEYQKMSELLGIPVEEIKLPDVKMILLIEKQHRRQIDRHFRALKAALKYYGLWYGPYPYRTITMVDPPFRTGSGGMEYPTLFTAGTSVLAPKEVLSPEGVIIHEFGHGYWYGMVANNEFEEAWLDEGINTYSTGRVAAVAYGPGQMPLRFNGLPLNWLLKIPATYDWQTDRLFISTITELDPVVNPSWKFYNSASYSLNVYMRASTCLNTLERLLGEKTWARIMRTYHMRYRFKHPKTEDFIRVVNEVAGKDLTWFFDEFFRSTKNFDYGISSVESRLKPEKWSGVFEPALPGEPKNQKKSKDGQEASEATKKEKIYESTVIVRRFGEASVSPEEKIKLKVIFSDGSVEWREWDGQGRWARFEFEKPAQIKQAILDPEGIWLMDSNLANNTYSEKGPAARLWALSHGLLWLMQNFWLTLSNLL
ncbi:MAG: M1 family metallopeptidase [Candidatus Saccharicenans sp.]